MKSYRLIFLMVVFGFTAGVAHAGPYVDLIERTCTQAAKPEPQSELSVLLNKVQEDFKDQETRVKNPTAFVAALDNVIAHSEFANIINCRESIKQYGYTYQISFQDPAQGDQSMSVDTNGNKVTLNFNLTKSVQRVLFVYLHEMTHVCQTPERERSASVGDYVRFSMFGEVEAFFNMQLAYRKFLPLCPRLCQAYGTSSDSPQGHLSEAYIDGERRLERGEFAQSIVNGYMDFYKDYQSEIVDLSSPMHTYADPITKSQYQLHTLDARFKILVGRLPFSVVEPTGSQESAAR